jgi:CRP-like cAMP-binding protein
MNSINSLNSIKCACCDARSEDIGQAFSFLSAAETEELCSYLELREWPADAVVFKEGVSADDYVGFLIEGKLVVKNKTEYWDKNIIIAILEKGAMVGEGTLSARKMEELIAKNPTLAIKILKRMLYIMNKRLRKAGERISELL